MLKTRVMPCLLLEDGGLVKTVKFKKPYYVGDPMNAVRIYNMKEVDELIFLDITATEQGRGPNFQLLSEIATECFMPFSYGGGVSTMEHFTTLFRLGVEKVAVNALLGNNPDLIRQAGARFGKQSIIASIDVKKDFFGKYRVMGHRGRKLVAKDPVAYAKEIEALGVGEILLYSIDRDGTWEGYDLDLLSLMTKSVGIPVIACGGASCVEDFRDAVKLGGADAVAAGSMVVFQGKDCGVLIKFPERKRLEALLGT